MAEAEDFYEGLLAFITENELLIDLKHLSVGSRMSEGSTSIVHEGRYGGIPVAIKIIQPKCVGTTVSDELKGKFAREIRLLNQGRHNDVVSLIGASMEPNLLIVMELMEGGSLKNYLWKIRSQLPNLKQSISFALDISRAMQHLHGIGIVHGDLKPSNLVLAADRMSLKVADFGLANLVGAGQTVKRKAPEAGNIRWMAPELLIAPVTYDHKIDIYSFSMVLWELLTNEMPLKKVSPSVVTSDEVKESRPSVDNLPVPAHIVRLLESCWAKDIAIRPEFTVITAHLLEFFNTL